MQEIEEQLCKLDSDKCVVEVCFYTLLRGRKRNYAHFQRFYTALHNGKEHFEWIEV